MTRRATAFSKTEVRRAIEATRAAGLPIAGVRVDANGFTVLTSSAKEETRIETDADALDKALGIQGHGKSEDTLLPG